MGFELPGQKRTNLKNTLPLFYYKLHSQKNILIKFLFFQEKYYACREVLLQFFSSIKNIKIEERDRLTDKHLANNLRIKVISFDADIKNIMIRKHRKILFRKSPP